MPSARDQALKDVYSKEVDTDQDEGLTTSRKTLLLDMPSRGLPASMQCLAAANMPVWDALLLAS